MAQPYLLVFAGKGVSSLTVDFMPYDAERTLSASVLSDRKGPQPTSEQLLCVLLILSFIWLFGSLRPCKNTNIINVFKLELAQRKNAFYLGNGGSSMHL